MKRCTKCLEIKEVINFYKDNQKKDGLSSACKVCKNKQYAKRNILPENKKNKKEYDDKYRKTEQGVITEQKSQIKKRLKYKNNTEYRDKELKRHKVLRAIPSQKIKAKEYQQNIPNETRAKHNREYIRKNKHLFAWRQILADTHKRMGTKKETSTVIELGYSALELKMHLESKFKNGMTWDNHGLWHIDHKKPVSKFPKNTSTSEVNALSNLQPLWAFENLSKGGTYVL